MEEILISITAGMTPLIIGGLVLGVFLLMMAPELSLIVMFAFIPIAIAAGAQPTIKVTRVNDECRQVTITRFFGLTTVLDAEVCGDEAITLNGEEIPQEVK